MSLVSSLRQRSARAAFILVLVAVTVLGVAAVAMAAPSSEPAGGEVILPVEPDGGIGGEVILPVEPDGGIGD
jgi:hypothetical protein